MKCPNCGNQSLGLLSVLTCSNGDPVSCSKCGAQFWVQRVLSKIVLYSYWYTGIGILVAVLAFLQSIWLGLLVLIGVPILQLFLSAFEIWVLGLKIHVGKSKT